MSSSTMRRNTTPRRAAVCAPTITAFDLLAGIGGFRAGGQMVSRANIEFVGACEIDRFANRTYEAMFGDGNKESRVQDLRSITRFPGEKESDRPIPSEERTARIRDSLPSFDMLMAGFPCQPHSLMGNRRGMKDDRGAIFFDIAEVLRAVRPHHFILENVRAIRSVNGGRFFRSIMSTLEQELGYTVRLWELNAADYGVPQVRRRVFFVGSYGALPEEPPLRVSLATTPFPTAWHLLEREVDDKYYLSDQILKTILKDQHKGYSRKAEINRLIARPLTRTMHKMHRASQDNYYSDDFIRGTYDPDRNEVLRNPAIGARIRRITPREALRIQSFPEDSIERALETGVSNTQLYMQAGNAVPPMMVRAILDHIFG